jgi:hypothetical protein
VRRIAVAVFGEPAWTPDGISPPAWRQALAEDVLDVLGTLAEVDAGAVALDGALLRDVGWPGLRHYTPDALDIRTVIETVTADGYDQVALVAADAPDLPGLHIAKLLRPLTSHPVAVAGAGEAGLLGLATVVPAPDWLPRATLDELTPQRLRRYAPRAADVASGAPWRRMRGPEDLGRLDPRLRGFETTRTLLDGQPW